MDSGVAATQSGMGSAGAGMPVYGRGWEGSGRVVSDGRMRVPSSSCHWGESRRGHYPPSSGVPKN